MAWCSACDEVLLKEGGEWNDKSEAFAGVSILCEGCFETIRAKNT